MSRRAKHTPSCATHVSRRQATQVEGIDRRHEMRRGGPMRGRTDPRFSSWPARFGAMAVALLVALLAAALANSAAATPGALPLPPTRPTPTPTATPTSVPTTAPPPYRPGLAGRAANGAGPVGYANSPPSTPGATGAQTLIEHWNGTAWSIVPSPNFSTTLADQLTSVTAIANNNAWAVGKTQTLPYYQDHTLILHWDGASWTIASSFSTSGGLLGVSATSASDIWAVGAGGGPTYTPLALHNNGTAWSVVPSPGVQNSDVNVFEGVDALTTSNVWAAGYTLFINYIGEADPVYNYVPLVEHWDGTAWSIVPSADPVPIDGY